MTAISLSPAQSRRLALKSQGLDRTTPFGLGLSATLQAIEHLGYVQIDTISVVERAHHHVLWSRVPDYRPEWLGELLSGRQVHEYWSHAASILPMRDFRHSLPRMKAFRTKMHWSEDTPALQSAMRRVLARVRREGAVRSRDFEKTDDHDAGYWSFSKIEKRALHELWMRGTLMISGREGFQKVYDLRERVVPKDVDHSLPRAAEAADFLIERTLRAHGIAREAEMRYMQGGPMGKLIRQRLAVAVRKGTVLPVHVGAVVAYVRPESLESLPDGIEEVRARILSPFDNLVIQRERLRWLFEFDYQIECYVPEGKRKYGHFVLPVLWGDRFAARLEAKARRKDGTLEVIGLWLEKGMEKNRPFRRALEEELDRFARFNGCRTVKMAH